MQQLNGIKINEWDPSHGDFIKENAIEDEELFQRSIKRNILVKVGLTALYFLLLVFSFVYFS